MTEILIEEKNLTDIKKTLKKKLSLENLEEIEGKKGILDYNYYIEDLYYIYALVKLGYNDDTIGMVLRKDIFPYLFLISRSKKKEINKIIEYLNKNIYDTELGKYNMIEKQKEDIDL